MISPSIGRVVWFYMTKEQRDFLSDIKDHRALITCDGDQPMAALVAHVHTDRCVNLAVFDHNGASFAFTSVSLLQDEETPAGNGMWASWMPYQVGQAKKHEAEDKAA